MVTAIKCASCITEASSCKVCGHQHWGSFCHKNPYGNLTKQARYKRIHRELYNAYMRGYMRLRRHQSTKGLGNLTNSMVLN